MIEKNDTVQSNIIQVRKCVGEDSESEEIDYGFYVIESEQQSRTLEDDTGVCETEQEGEGSESDLDKRMSISADEASNAQCSPEKNLMVECGRPPNSRLTDSSDSCMEGRKKKKRGRPSKPKDMSDEKKPIRPRGRPVIDPTNKKLLHRREIYHNPNLKKLTGRPVNSQKLSNLERRQKRDQKQLIEDVINVASGHLAKSAAQKLIMQVSSTKQGVPILQEFSKLAHEVEMSKEVDNVLKAVKTGVRRLKKESRLLVDRTAAAMLPAASCMKHLGMTKRHVQDLKKTMKVSYDVSSLADKHSTVRTLSDVMKVPDERCTVSYFFHTRTVTFTMIENPVNMCVMDILPNDEIGLIGSWNPAYVDVIDRYFPVASVDPTSNSIILQMDLFTLESSGTETQYISGETKINLSENVSKFVFRRWTKGEEPQSRTCLDEQYLYRKMFDESTTSKSGMVTTTRLLLTSKEKLYESIFSKYPNYVLDLIREKPNLLAEANRSTRKTKFQRDLILVGSIATMEEPSFGSETTRMQASEQMYRELLAKHRIQSGQKIFPPRFRPGKVEKKALSIDQIGQIREVSPVTEKTFWYLIENVLKIKYTSVLNPTFCNLCETGPGFKQTLELAEAQLLRHEGEIVRLRNLLNSTEEEAGKIPLKPELEKEIASHTRVKKKIALFQTKVIHYEEHLKQKEWNRKRVHEIQRNLKPGECLCFRDFVNNYNARGKKIMNLVLVVLYVEVEGQDPPCVSVVHNLSDHEIDKNNKTDRFYAMDVLQFHLDQENGSKLFNRFHTIWISGDHGSHFSARETIYFEAMAWERYGKTLREINLASYHCYNRCDGSGAAVVALAKDQAKEGADLVGARQYVDCIRNFGAENTWAFLFDKINRSPWLVQGYLAKTKTKGKKSKSPYVEEDDEEYLRRQCDIRFDLFVNGETVHLDGGIILCRPVIGEGQYKMINLGTKYQKTFCKRCSNASTNTNRIPVFHKEQESNETSEKQNEVPDQKRKKKQNEGPGVHCPELDITIVSSGRESLFEGMDLAAEPAPDRIRGDQIRPSEKAWLKQNGKGATPKEKNFICRFLNCQRRFVHPGAANTHMETKHSAWVRLEESRYPIVKRTVTVSGKGRGPVPAGSQKVDETQEQEPHESVQFGKPGDESELVSATQSDGVAETQIDEVVTEDSSQSDKTEAQDPDSDASGCDEGDDSEGEHDEGDNEENNFVDYYVPRDHAAAPSIGSTVFALYCNEENGTCEIHEGKVQPRNIAPNSTPVGSDKVLFKDECFDVERDRIDLKKDCALLRCCMTNAMNGKGGISIPTLEAEMRACYHGQLYKKSRQTELKKYLEKNAPKELEAALKQQLIDLIERLDKKSSAAVELSPYENTRQKIIEDNHKQLCALGLVHGELELKKEKSVRKRRNQSNSQQINGLKRASLRLMDHRAAAATRTTTVTTESTAFQDVSLTSTATDAV